MKCVMCGHEGMQEKTTDYVYDASGLAVTLKGVRAWVCDECGEEEVEVQSPGQLEVALAKALLGLPGRLEGAEIRFLRKFLGYSGKDFAKLIGVNPATLSRWEAGKKTMDRGNENTLRLLAAQGHRITDYEAFDEVENMLNRIGGKAPDGLRPLKLQEVAGVWKVLPSASLPVRS